MRSINICFEVINPTPTYPDGYSAVSFDGLSWDSRAVVVKQFKSHVKKALREIQVGRCCYCRRHLGDIHDTHLEHFVEKSAFPVLTFSIKNLSLSCSTCNTMKNACFRKHSARESKRQSRITKSNVKALRSPVLICHLPPAMTDPDEYRWLNPHLDPFSDHIDIRKNWVFFPKSAKGRRVTRNLRLNALRNVEVRAASERLAAKKGTLAFAVGLMSESVNFGGSALVQIAVAEIKRRRALSKNKMV